MKKRLVMFSIMMIVLLGMTTTVYAAGSVEFTDQNELKISNTDFGTEFHNMAPGEINSQTINLINHNGNATDFYMQTEAIRELERDHQAAGGAYDIKLELNKQGVVTVLYDSSLGGAVTGSDGSIVAEQKGLLLLNSSEIGTDTTFLTSLNNKESASLILTIGLDGESIRNTEQNTYHNATGILGFEFLAAYREPDTGKIVQVNRVVTQSSTPLKNIVQTFKEVVVGVKTGDHTMIGLFAGILVMGILLIAATGKKKKTEEPL